MKRVLGYLRPLLPKMGWQLLIKLVGTVVELMLPWMLSYILDKLTPLGQMGPIWLWGGLMALCAATALVCNIVANRMATRISRAATRQLRHDLYQRTSHLSCAQVDGFTTSSLVSRMTSDTYNVHLMIDRMQRLGVRAPIMLLGGLAMTISLEPVLSLVLLGVLPLLGAVVWFVSTRSVPLYTRTQAALDGLVRKVQENMSGVRVIKALSKVEYEQSRFDAQNRELAEKERQAGVLAAVTNPVMNLLLNLGLTLVVVVGAYRVSGGATQPGTIIAFLSYFTMILNALMMVSRLFTLYSKGAASARRIAQVLDCPDDMPLKAARREDTPYQMEFSHVTFSYNKRAPNLTDISFRLKKGETLGIIGPTGSGKSTVLQLLMRFYDPDEGDIRIDGRPVASIPPEELYSLFGVALQNDFLMADSIRENIDYGRALPLEALRHAARAAQAGFIDEKLEGMALELTQKGANLSGGQKQRLLIARALAGDPRILLLDDSSSALDYRTDAELRKALAREYGDTTTIIVAQRVSSILHADHILVLEEGRAIGYGTHQELLQSCPDYREITRVQMGEVA